VASAFWFATVMAVAQVGAASIFGVLELRGTLDDDAWMARLTLVLWFAVSSAVAGAYAGGRGATSGIRLSSALAAGFGGAAGASVALYPLGSAVLEQGDPRLLAGIALGFAAVAGFILAFGFLAARALAWNAAVVSLLVWGLLAAAIATKAPQVRLAQLDTPNLSRSLVHGLSMWGLPVMVAVLSLLTAIVARVRGHHRAAIAFSGLAGAATIALAYALAGPGSSDAQKIPWTSALVAAVAGLTASVLVALPRRTPDEADEVATLSSSWSSASTSDSAFPLPDSDIPRRRTFADLDDRPYASGSL
jgi:hypothetical protein